ncbi:MAG TPA: hypothetical protein VNV66_01525 [Pilimelia sp.]|nr:hypothetical protein [Pilimelia sp.]
MHRRLALWGLTATLLTAACADAPGSAASSQAPDAAASAPREVAAAFERRAVEVAAAWRAAARPDAWRRGLVPLQSLTVAPAGELSDEARQAIRAGWFRLDATLPSDLPSATGQVRFPDGATLRVPLTGAVDAYRAIRPGEPPDCAPTSPRSQPTGSAGADSPDAAVTDVPGCTVLTVTDVRLGTAPLRTSRGEATVPAWLFTVRGLPGPLARVAVAPDAVGTPPSPAPGEPPHVRGLVYAQELTEVAGARVGYRLGIGACDGDPAPLVYEADDLVVVGGSVTPSTGVCTEQLVLHPVAVTLTAPLGARPVLNAQTGQLLPLVTG